MQSTAVEVRSVSPRTVVASENAMAESASESQSTASRALPRWLIFLVVIIFEGRVAVHMDLRGHAHRPQTEILFIERSHFDANGARPSRQHPQRRPLDGRGRRRRLLVGGAAERKAVRQYKRLRTGFNGSKQAAVRLAQDEQSGRGGTRAE